MLKIEKYSQEISKIENKVKQAFLNSNIEYKVVDDNKNTIKKTYFKDLGLSDDDYNQNISQDSLVYIAVQVTSKYPIEENPVSKRVFLPLINFFLVVIILSYCSK